MEVWRGKAGTHHLPAARVCVHRVLESGVKLGLKPSHSHEELSHLHHQFNPRPNGSSNAQLLQLRIFQAFVMKQEKSCRCVWWSYNADNVVYFSTCASHIPQCFRKPCASVETQLWTSCFLVRQLTLSSIVFPENP